MKRASQFINGYGKIEKNGVKTSVLNCAFDTYNIYGVFMALRHAASVCKFAFYRFINLVRMANLYIPRGEVLPFDF